MKMKPILVSCVFGVLAMGMIAAGSAPDRIVLITEYGFDPDRVSVVEGKKVVFQNTTDKDHTVVSKPEGQSERMFSGAIKPRTSWQHTFSKEGTYIYVCQQDQNETGTVVVTRKVGGRLSSRRLEAGR